MRDAVVPLLQLDACQWPEGYVCFAYEFAWYIHQSLMRRVSLYVSV